MNHLIQQKLEGVRNLCAKHRVKRLDLFGSATRDDFDPAASDFDFLVEFERMPPTQHANNFFGLLEDLERLLGGAVDLLEPAPIENPYLWESIVQSRKAVYEAA